jgi:helicase
LCDYVIANSTSFPLDAELLIVVLTPEKIDLLLQERPEMKFDFFAIDEIYKIQDDDERKSVFTNVLYNLSRSNADFYLIGPYFKQFSRAFLTRTHATFAHFGIEVVQKNVFNVYDVPRGETFELDGSEIVKAAADETTLKRVIAALKDQQLIYQNTRRGAESLATKVASWATERREHELINYIKETIAEDWCLVGCLERGVAFHHGSMPRFIQNYIVDSFNNREIQTLICTTTLTEGVNTTAKNIVLFSNKKGRDVALTGFDYKNLKGRAGRFLQHFVGNVIAFHPVIEGERDLISFYYFDSDDIGSGEVISIDEADLTQEAKSRRQRVLDILTDER